MCKRNGNFLLNQSLAFIYSFGSNEAAIVMIWFIEQGVKLNSIFFNAILIVLSFWACFFLLLYVIDETII